ncbi:MAG: Pr6Pr family membrane protein [Rhodanobacter sp.]
MQFRTRRKAQIWHTLTFVVAAFAVILQLVLEIEAARRLDLSTQIIRFCSYLTIWFNALIAGTCVVLAVNPLHDGRAWRALRLDAVVIGVGAGIVHWFLLRPLVDLHGAYYLADKLMHIAVPLLTLVGWLIFGPRNRVDRADVCAFFVVPGVWLAYTLIRGPIVGWYPYPFIDVGLHGYAVVGAISVAIGALLSALAAGALWLDRRLDVGNLFEPDSCASGDGANPPRAERGAHTRPF